MKKKNQTSQHRPTKPLAIRNKILVLLSSLIVVVLVVAYGVVLATDLMGAKHFLLQGSDNLQLAYLESEKAELGRAGEHFKQSKDNFLSASKILNRPSVSILTPVPVVNKNVLALRQLTSTGIEATLAGDALMRASMSFPQKNGKIDLGINNGQIDLRPFIAAKPYFDQANFHSLLAVAEYGKMPNPTLLSSIERARDELGQQLPKLRSITKNAKQAVDSLPGILGANGKRRYFLAVQNNAELRATGGLIGSYGVITVENGKFTLDAFDEIHKLEKKNQPPVDAPEDFVSRYSRFKGTSMWLNVNMSPDFPTVSRLLVKLYKSVTGDSVDGVISVDPVALKYLLVAIGPVKIPGASIDVDANNVVDWTLVQAYAHYPENKERKDFLADVAKAVWEHMVSGQIEDKTKFVDQLSLALSEKHMAFFSTYEQEQKLAESLGYAGAILPTSDDYLQVLMQNHGGNKVDIYMHEKIDYSINLRPDGSGLAKLTIKISNETPLIGLPEYVAGEHPLGAKGGYSNTWLNIFVPKGAQLLVAKEDGVDSEVEVGFEKDKTAFSQYVEIAPRASKTVDLTYELPHVLIPNNDRINYSLDWQVQPAINKPDSTFKVIAPQGFEFSQLPADLKREGKVISYNGVLMKDQRFDFSLVDNR
ncbi:MAG TPA: DUF4012 domain-containing protein [Candidatus Aquicultor sp.]|jgi:hypothetical protein